MGLDVGRCSQAGIKELADACAWSVTVLLNLSILRDLPPKTMTAPTARLTRRLFKY